MYIENGRCFAGEFIMGRTEKEQGKIRYYIELLEKRGPSLREPYSKKISSSLYELRPSFGNTEMRILYFWDGNLAWIVSGFVKKDQKTPARELKLATKRMQRYINAKGAKK